MILEESKLSFLLLPYDEALSLIMSIRQSRRTNKRPIVEKKVSAKKTKESTIDINSMSSDRAALLLSELLKRRKTI